MYLDNSSPIAMNVKKPGKFNSKIFIIVRPLRHQK